MRHIAVLAMIMACYCGVLSAAKPMETLERYNVVLVHGAAPENQGYGSLCGETIKDAWNTRNDFVFSMRDTTQDEKLPWNLGDAVGMLGKYEDDDEKKLTLWLDSAVFEDTVTYGSEYIYIQRSFTNPAESPAHNAHEIGDRTWKGDGNCSVRRALFEEAQEVRAHGSKDLNTMRNDSVSSYRTIPSRNILIAHSMGGVASQTVNSSVINAGPDKSITTIKSSMMQMKMIQNNGRMKVIDLKSGQTLPAQNVPRQNPADVTNQMGEASDYKAPVRLGSLWKLVPKDASRPTLFYSESAKRIVKMNTVVNGSSAEIALEYCDASCTLPGTLKKTEIITTLPGGEKSTVVMEIVSARARHILPAKMFNIE